MYNLRNLVNIVISVKNITLGYSNITNKHKVTTGYSLIREPTAMNMLANTSNYALITKSVTTMEMLISNKQNKNATPTNISEGDYTNSSKLNEILGDDRKLYVLSIAFFTLDFNI